MSDPLIDRMVLSGVAFYDAVRAYPYHAPDVKKAEELGLDTATLRNTYKHRAQLYAHLIGISFDRAHERIGVAAAQFEAAHDKAVREWKALLQHHKNLPQLATPAAKNTPWLKDFCHKSGLQETPALLYLAQLGF